MVLNQQCLTKQGQKEWDAVRDLCQETIKSEYTTFKYKIFYKIPSGTGLDEIHIFSNWGHGGWYIHQTFANNRI